MAKRGRPKKEPLTWAVKMYRSTSEQEQLLREIRCQLREINIVQRIQSKAILDSLRIISKDSMRTTINEKWTDEIKGRIDHVHD